MTAGIKTARPDSPAAECRSFESGPYRGLIMSRYADPLFLEAFAACDRLVESAGVEVLLEGRNKVVGIETVFSTGEKFKFVVKKFALRGVNRLKTLIQPSKAAKAWRGASGLEERGIGTPGRVAYVERKKGVFVDESYFIAERVTGYGEIRTHFLQPGPDVLDTLLPCLAKFLAGCHKAGVLHRDLSDGNVMVRRAAGTDWVFLLLDTNRIRLRRRISRAAKVKNLIRLGVPRPYQRDFLRRYFSESGCRPAWRLWYRLTKNTYVFYLGIKKALRLKKWARKLRIQ